MSRQNLTFYSYFYIRAICLKETRLEREPHKNAISLLIDYSKCILQIPSFKENGPLLFLYPIIKFYYLDFNLLKVYATPKSLCETNPHSYGVKINNYKTIMIYV